MFRLHCHKTMVSPGRQSHEVCADWDNKVTDHTINNATRILFLGFLLQTLTSDENQGLLFAINCNYRLCIMDDKCASYTAPDLSP